LNEINILNIDTRGFPRIINTAVLSQKLEELLKKKDLNGRNWSLIYKGSCDGFRAYDFHFRCDNKPKTITIVKSTSGNIFGGYSSAQWNPTGSWEYDKSAFIFSLLNKENRPLIFEHSSSGVYSIGSFRIFGPIFGDGNDIFISDSSNTNMSSQSNLGATYTHPDYPFGCERTRKILAGTRYFQVQEIEVLQLKQ
jgi:hypothetical protein